MPRVRAGDSGRLDLTRGRFCALFHNLLDNTPPEAG